MRRAYSPLTAFAVSLICLIGFGWIAYDVKHDHLSAFDDFFIRHIQGQENPSLTQVMKAFTFIGTTKPVILILLVVIVILIAAKRLWMESFFLIWVMLGQKLLNEAAKNLFQRERPAIHRLIEETGYSFPSGHAMTSICLYGALAYVIWGLTRSESARLLSAIVAALLILTIGCSRIYLGVHYPSDILGGYLLGASWLAASAGAFRLIAFRRSRSERHTKTTTTTF